MLQCGHSFCAHCLAQHLETEFGKGCRAWCPVCRREVFGDEVASVLPAMAAQAFRTEMELLKGPPIFCRSGTQEADRHFRSVARRLHLKKCPQCGVAIQKNGGCPKMLCRCGACFDWHEAETVVPCNRVHLCWSIDLFFISTCSGCTRTTKIKACLSRLGIAAISIPVATTAAVCVCGGVVAAVSTTVSAPIVGCAPIALLYEPVRRAIGHQQNWFAHAACSGVRLLHRTMRGPRLF